MNKMQTVKFQNLEAFFNFLPKDEYRLFIPLRNLVLDSVPGTQESLRYNVPYYKRNSGLFFNWPGAMFWGGKRTFEGVRYGFQRANLLVDPFDWLDRGKRKQVTWQDFNTLNSKDEEVLRYFIQASVWNDTGLLFLNRRT